MADFVFSGGCRWNDLCAVDVKVGADGTPISCKNPITGAEISGGGGAAKITAVNYEADDTVALTFWSDLTDDTSVVSEIDIISLGEYPEAAGSIYVDIPVSGGWVYTPQVGYPNPVGDVETFEVDGTTYYLIKGNCTFTKE